LSPRSRSQQEADYAALLKRPFAVVGSGGFGTTMAVLLAKKGYSVNQWVRGEELAFIMQDKRENQRYLPGVTLPLNIYITRSLADSVHEAGIVVMAVPSHAVREVAAQMAPHLPPDCVVVNVAKGIETETYKRMSQVLEEELGTERPIVALSGPNHAEEIARDMPGATVVASKTTACLDAVAEGFSTHTFKVYRHSDLVGVELGGATKNIVALATGVCRGIGYGDNTASAIITLGLTEMVRFGRHHGAKMETYLGLAGLGDLVATCTSEHSRNRYVGERLGKGETLEEIIKGMGGKVAEGVKAARFVYEYAQAHSLQLPLTNQVYRVLYEGKDVKKAVDDLLRLL
jgi:glycerol-3-phosphate dehydrogenase (NAD(P)+)